MRKYLLLPTDYSYKQIVRYFMPYTFGGRWLPSSRYNALKSAQLAIWILSVLLENELLLKPILTKNVYTCSIYQHSQNGEIIFFQWNYVLYAQRNAMESILFEPSQLKWNFVDGVINTSTLSSTLSWNRA